MHSNFVFTYVLIYISIVLHCLFLHVFLQLCMNNNLFIVIINANLLQFFSSAPLLQSALPSQCQLFGIHCFMGRPQLNWDSEQDLVAKKKNRKCDSNFTY